MIFDRLSTLVAAFGLNNPVAPDVARRWRAAFGRDPRLPEDVIRLSGLLACQPVRMVHGVPEVAPIDPHRLAYEAGRRDMALLLLAQGGVTNDELNNMMEASDGHQISVRDDYPRPGE